MFHVRFVPFTEQPTTFFVRAFCVSVCVHLLQLNRPVGSGLRSRGPYTIHEDWQAHPVVTCILESMLGRYLDTLSRIQDGFDFSCVRA